MQRSTIRLSTDEYILKSKEIYGDRYDYSLVNYVNNKINVNLICKEHDGKQHFESIEWFGGIENFIVIQKHDNIRNEYCKNNNINLLRIGYTENIEEKLKDIIC